MVDFDPNDDNIPQKLRNRFTSWHTNVPRLQYSQYGPINKYLNLKFPDAMVKPQGLMRPIMLEGQVELEMGDDGLDDVGNISIDSTGQYVSKQDSKRYPDFIVASYYEDEEKYDKIRLILEIGSLHKKEPASMNTKKEIQRQLHDYMVLLGEEGARWATNVLGVAILGIEVCFSHPRRSKQNRWVTYTSPLKWYDLYDGTFVKEIDKMAEMCRRDED